MAAGGLVIMVPRSRCPFLLTTKAAFTVEGVWLIKADFSFHKTAKGPLRALVNQARLAVMAAITRQGAAWLEPRGEYGAGPTHVRADNGPIYIQPAPPLIRSFIFFHDCGHGSFFGSQRANHLLGIPH